MPITYYEIYYKMQAIKRSKIFSLFIYIKREKEENRELNIKGERLENEQKR